MKIIIGIYRIVSPSGKMYVGQSWNIKARWSYYKTMTKRARQLFLLHSFIKYGFDAHKFEVIHELPADVEQSTLDYYEQYYIDTYRNAGIALLNLKEAGAYGKMHQSVKDRLRIAATGKKKSPEARAKIAAANRLRVLSQETKDKIGDANRGRILTDEQRLKTGLASRGIKRSEKFKQAVHKRFIGVPKSDEHKKRLSEARIQSGVAKGSNNPKAKLNENIVREIRAKFASGATLTQLYKEYNMSKSGMHSIITGKNWPTV